MGTRNGVVASCIVVVSVLLGSIAQPQEVRAQEPSFALPTPFLGLPDPLEETQPGPGLPALPPSRPPASPTRPPADAKELERRGIVRAEIRPGRPYLLSVPYPGLLISVAVHDGERVEQGATVGVLDKVDLEREVAEAKRVLAETLDAVQEQAVAGQKRRADLEERLAANADKVHRAEERLAESTLRAPFNGRVTEIRARAGQHLKRGDVVAELAEDGDLEIICTVPSLWVSSLKPGHLIWVYVEESGRSYEAEFVRFGGRVDPVNKTIRTYSRFRAAPEELLPGMSGRADFFPKPANTNS